MRRLFWLTVGAAAGASGTIWAQRRVRDQLDQLDPDRVVVTAGVAAGRAAGRGAVAVGRTVAAAVGDGRTAMSEREIELRERLLGDDPAPTAGVVRRQRASGTDPRGR